MPDNDFDCMLCWADAFPLRDNAVSFRQLAEAFAAECGGAPAQLDHYAWQHLSAGNAVTPEDS